MNDSIPLAKIKQDTTHLLLGKSSGLNKKIYPSILSDIAD
jgi:hypothetical protein